MIRDAGYEITFDWQQIIMKIIGMSMHKKNEREFKNVTFSSISGAKMPKAQDMKLVWLWD